MIYFASDGKYVKIGYTRGKANVVRALNRIRTLQVGNPLPIVLIGLKDGDLQEEDRLHRKYAKKRAVGEWFLLSPAERAELSVFETSPIVIPKTAQIKQSRCDRCHLLKADPLPELLVVGGVSQENSFICRCYLVSTKYRAESKPTISETVRQRLLSRAKAVDNDPFE